MFKKKPKIKNTESRVESEIRSEKTDAPAEITVKTHDSKKKNKKVKNKAKKKSNGFNWFFSLLLIGTAIGVLVLYPAPDPQKNIKLQNTKTTNTQVTTPSSVFNAQALSKELVSRYFNGTTDDKSEQEIALENTLLALKSSSNAEAQKVLDELQSSNINAAKKSLIQLASSQASLQEASKAWVNIGNIQNLSSSNQALQAFKKASEIDPDNMNAYSRQAHVYRQRKQFDLAEKAYKRVQSFANQSTANQALTLAKFGRLNVSKGKLVEAEDAFNQSLSIYKKIEDDAGIADTSYSLANLFKGSERFGQAQSYYKTALAKFTEADDFKKMANTHAALGSLYQAMQLNPKAQKQYEIALEINTNNNYEENTPEIYQNLGAIAEENGETEKAQAYFAKANGTVVGEKQDNQVADQLGREAIANRKQGNFLKAEEQHKQAINIYQQNKSIAGTISQQINLGFLYKVWDKKDLACLVWRDTLVISQRAKSTRTSRVKQLVDNSCN